MTATRSRSQAQQACKPSPQDKCRCSRMAGTTEGGRAYDMFDVGRRMSERRMLTRVVMWLGCGHWYSWMGDFI